MNKLTGFTVAGLQNAPTVTAEDTFQFECRPGISCFTRCCGDVNIFLTPYDVLRLKNALGLSSEDFLAQYTLLPFHPGQMFPVVMLRMKDEEGKRCPFVTEQGCGVYADRPWACRMYPLGSATHRARGEGTEGDGRGEKGTEGSPKSEIARDEEFYFVLRDGPCQGWDAGRTWSVREWLRDQGVDLYDEMGRHFKELTLHEYFQRNSELDPKKMDMFFMATFDLDRFRRFVFESRFLQLFEVAATVVESLRTDDVALMRFGYDWLRFSLFGEPTMKIREAVTQAKREQAAFR
jgi:Fe-S-cluster containining protein